MRRLTESQRRTLAFVRAHRWEMLAALAVENKRGRLQRMDDPTPAQARWATKVHRMARRPGEDGWTELLAVKPRQVRYSHTMLASDFVDALGDEEPLRTVVAVHHGDSVKALFGKVKTFILNLPPELSTAHDWQLNHNDHTIVSRLTGARFDFLTAGGTSEARAWTYQRGRMDEFGRWPQNMGQDFFASVTSTMEDDAPVIYLSTSRGRDKLFYPKAQIARAEYHKGNPRIGFEFSPWYEEPTYRKRPDPGWEPNADDARVIGLYGLDLDQAFWRAEKVRGVRGMGDAQFRREFPATFDEAFLEAQGGWYDSAHLDAVRASLLADGHEEVTREVRVYRPPRDGMVYAAGIDPSWCTGNDDAVMQVRDIQGRLCATVATNKPGAPDEPMRGVERFAELCVNVLLRYGKPKVLCESNTGGAGPVILKVLRRERMNLFQVLPDKRTGKMKDWVTSQGNKAEAYEHHRQVVNGDMIELRDHQTIDQMYYIREIDGKIEGVGNRDDHVDADVLCEWCRKSLPGAKFERKYEPANPMEVAEGNLRSLLGKHMRM